uniref:Uncharacterized protein n=1 Tax=Arundo donax TaxID=35708 RepID=A0A0A9HQU2_ARUDO
MMRCGLFSLAISLLFVTPFIFQYNVII